MDQIISVVDLEELRLFSNLCIRINGNWISEI